MNYFPAHLRAAGCLLGVSLICPATAWAAEASDENKLAEEIVVTGVVDQLQLNKVSEGGSRLNLTPLQTPASVEILDGDAIRLRGDLTIQCVATTTMAG